MSMGIVKATIGVHDHNLPDSSSWPGVYEHSGPSVPVSEPCGPLGGLISPISPVSLTTGKLSIRHRSALAEQDQSLGRRQQISGQPLQRAGGEAAQSLR